MTTLKVPDKYGYVLLTTFLGQFIVSNVIMGGRVMAARQQFNVPYPNMYATPGHHEKADAFNRVQLGHMNIYEQLTLFTAMTLVGGLMHPISCSVYTVLFYVGAILYQIGYSDTKLDVTLARYRKGGWLKWVGFFGAMSSSVALAGNLNGWW
jgi:glutathione S-transferase